MKKIILILICTCASMFVHAGGPGYFGKKTTVGAQFAYSIYPTIPFKTQYGFHAHFVCSRSIEIGCFVNWGKYKELTSGEGTRHSGKTFGIAPHVRIYRTQRKGAIAPVGPYLEFGAEYNKAEYHRANFLDVSLVDVNETYLLPQVGAGYKTVVFRCLGVTAGMRCAIFPIELNDQDGEHYARNMVYWKNVFSFHTGIGYMF